MTITTATLSGTRTELPDDVLDQFRAQLRGEVLTASDPGFDQVRPVFNAMHQEKPALAIECSGTADVIDAVNFARDRQLAVTVRGGGHSVAGLSSQEGGVLIDLSQMRAVDVDVEERVAHVQGGALWGDVDRETQAFGLATPGGVVSDTGVAGLTLGGGYGWLRRKYGLSCDNVLSAKVVCADGVLRTASPATNPDLFWAIRGGGGNFGIITSFTFRLHELGPIVAAATVFYPMDAAEQVLRRWRDHVATVPDEVTTELVCVTMPAAPELPPEIHDQPCVVVAGVYAGKDLDAGMRALQPLRELGTPLADASQPMPYSVIQSDFDAFFPRAAFQAYWKSVYLPDLTDGAIDVVAAKARHRPTPLTLVNLLHMGGAVARVGEEETAFAQRRAPFMVSIDGHWPDPAQNAEKIAWVRSAWDDVARFGTGEVYLNFMGLADEAPSTNVDTAFGRNLARLAQIKATYDPGNFFRNNNNITPAS
ncbi:FAD-binding oxidoreductase [Phytohabitans rumicis]|uniref:FAD-linked oxidase n=1 Tax=Phytohabitans rumicis TaxID=1076125 RepID=A0A6V8L0K3_9ACTN|nr:FAD-binding oxidoreductase [Phytohabitans rumicis]GFJ88508.1 FAD-linked oxidase [Phytohabitans rumicis]